MPNRHENMFRDSSDGRFPTTEWTKIQDPARREAILAELYQKYQRPLYHFLRYKGFTDDKAKDLVQGFFTEKVLGRQFIQKADKARGKFRTFLLSAVANYVIDVQRHEKPSRELYEKTRQPNVISDPETEFNRAWAEKLLQEVLEEIEEECRRSEKLVHWQVFKVWVLESEPDNSEIRMCDICTKYGVSDTSKAYNMISNTKKRFRTILRRRLRPLVESDAEIDAEIREFINIFSVKLTR